jgi:hypothetical protein
MSKLAFFLPAVIAGAGLLVATFNASAKPADATKTKKSCTFCHKDAKKTPKDLTEAGNYYKEKKTLDGYTGK